MLNSVNLMVGVGIHQPYTEHIAKNHLNDEFMGMSPVVVNEAVLNRRTRSQLNSTRSMENDNHIDVNLDIVETGQ